MSRSANDEHSETDSDWGGARNQLFGMIMEGRSFSGGERNCCFLNTGQERFGTISSVSGLDFADDARSIAITDWDQDGDQDLWISNRNAPRLRFMRNNADPNHRFVSLRLVGNGTSTNRDAIGARVIVELDNGDEKSGTTKLFKTLRAGEGFLSQSSKWLHFGLGASVRIRRIVVRWPGGADQEFVGLTTNNRYRLEQGRSSAELQPRLASASGIRSEQTPPLAKSKVARVFLETRVKMPTISFTSPDGMVRRETFDTGRPTLVNLWASWCAPCVQELSEFAAKRQQIEDARVRVLSLTVDMLGDQPHSKKDVKSRIQQIGYPHDWGYLDADQMNHLQELQNLFFFLRQPLPLPSSFLMDAEGRLSVIYKGPVSVEQFLKDARTSPKGHQEFAKHSAQIAGTSLDHARVRAVAKRSDSLTRHRVALWLKETGRLREAIEHFVDISNIDPKWELPHSVLAKMFFDQNELGKAKQYATNALRLNSRNADAHNTMGLICSRMGDLARADAHFRHSIQQNSKSAGAFNNLGIVSAMQGKIEFAGKCFRRAVEIDPEFAQAHINLGNIYAGSQDSKRAIEHYQRAIELDPKNVEPYNNLGTMFGKLGEIERAIQSYRAALKIDPANQNAQQYLKNALRVLNSQKK